MYDDPNFDLPSARKTPSGDPPSAPFIPGGNPWSAPLTPDHRPPPSAPYDPSSSQWGGYAAGDPLSTPYNTPLGGNVPPPPPGRAPQGGQAPRKRRRLAAILLSIFFIGLLGTITGYLLTRGTGDSTTATTTTGPVAVATDKPTVTPTLKPGQTPLPTKVPTATPQPTAPPNQPTYTPVPTSTPVPYASRAVVSFKRSTKGVSVGSTLTAATSGGTVSATQYTPSVTQVASAAFDANQNPGQSITFTLTVYNHSTTSSITSSGVQVQSTDGLVTCVVQGSVTIPKGGNATQQCTTPAQHFNAASWDDTTAIKNLEYKGSSPAGGQDPSWNVPADCATNSTYLSAAHTAAQAALQTKLNGMVSGQTFYGPQFSFTDGSATCSPVAGTTESSDFSFTVAINGSAVQTTFNPTQVKSYQQTQLQNAAANVAPAGSYTLIGSAVCGTPSVGATTSTSATITCTASGTAGWIWNSSNENTIANLINGESKGSALAALNSVQGIVAGSVSISLTGGSYLPVNASAISFSIS